MTFWQRFMTLHRESSIQLKTFIIIQGSPHGEPYFALRYMSTLKNKEKTTLRKSEKRQSRTSEWRNKTKYQKHDFNASKRLFIFITSFALLLSSCNTFYLAKCHQSQTVRSNIPFCLPKALQIKFCTHIHVQYCFICDGNCFATTSMWSQWRKVPVF